MGILWGGSVRILIRSNITTSLTNNGKMPVEDLESKRILTVCACMKRELYSVTAENSEFRYLTF